MNLSMRVGTFCGCSCCACGGANTPGGPPDIILREDGDAVLREDGGTILREVQS